MTVYVLSWENSDMETMVFSSFEKANSVAKFILNHLPSGKIAWEEQDEDSIVYHLDYQNDEDVNEEKDNYGTSISADSSFYFCFCASDGGICIMGCTDLW